MNCDDIRSQQLVPRPGDAGYDEELAGFQTGFAQRPDVIFAATSADDVVAAVAYAAGAGLPVGVQATGQVVEAAAPHGLRGAADGPVVQASQVFLMACRAACTPGPHRVLICL
ncbi:hypothetical protein [Streptomyces sp. NPDC055134]